MEGSNNNEKINAIKYFIIHGTITALVYKLMGLQDVNEGGVHKKFFHPYMQTVTVFIGQGLCLILYFKDKQKNTLQLQQGKKPHKYYCFAVPALADSISCILQFAALNFISASTYLMFKGAVIVTVAIFSKILFNLQISRAHLLGCQWAVLGLIVIGISGLFESTTSEIDYGSQALGFGLMLVSLISNGFLYAYQEFLMRNHTIHPLQISGWEGFFGVIFMTILSITLTFVPCHLGQSFCSFDSSGNAYMQRFDVFLVQVGNNFLLFVLVIFGIISCCYLNLFGLMVTKLYDALTRSLLNIIRTAIIWFIGIVVTLSVDKSSIYQLESTSIVVNIVKGIGFGLMVLGTLIYNELIFKQFIERQNTRYKSQNYKKKIQNSLIKMKSSIV